MPTAHAAAAPAIDRFMSHAAIPNASNTDAVMNRTWNALSDTGHDPILSTAVKVGTSRSTTKNATVRSITQRMSFFSEIRCMK